jgi:hypothetical protein
MGKSGQYIGFYNYGDGGAPHSMELGLSFAGSTLSGRGLDDVGHFAVRGVFSGETCSWTKAYSSHNVEYVGYVEAERIWGTWKAGLNRGGFMIWPKPARENLVQIVITDLVPLHSGGGHEKH